MLITLRPSGFEPKVLAIPRGKIILALDNRSGVFKEEMNFRLDRVGGNRLRDVRFKKGRRAWREILDLSKETWARRAVDDRKTMVRGQLLVMELYSRQALTKSFAEDQIRALIEFDGGIFTPERCDVYEPLRERFDPQQLDKPVQWLTIPGGEFKFRRYRPFRIQGYIQNAGLATMWIHDNKDNSVVQFEPKAGDPVFCTRWVSWLDLAVAQKKGSSFVKAFFRHIYKASESDYGFLTTEEDHKKKNFLVIQVNDGTRERFVGDNPEKGLPGLYWLNMFGPIYTNWFGIDKVNKLAGQLEEIETLSDGSVLVQFGESAASCESDEIISRQRNAIQILGEQGFFDISRPDRMLETPPALSRLPIRKNR